MKTLRRNSKRAQRIFDQATLCLCHSLDTGFAATPCDPSVAQDGLQHFSFARLREISAGRFQVRLTCNLWYSIESPA